MTDEADHPGADPAIVSDPDRAQILARRQRFISLALAGLTSCARSPDPPSTSPEGQQAAAGDEESDAVEEGDPPDESERPRRQPRRVAPQSCLRVALPPEDEP